MKKIKLITPILWITTLSSAVIPLVGCSCTNKATITPKISPDSSKEVTIKESKVIKGQDSTITLEIPANKEINTLEIKIGDKTLEKDKDYTIDSNNKITIKGKSVTGEDVSIKVTLKSIALTLIENTDICLDKATSIQISAHIDETQSVNGKTIKWEIVQGSDFINIDKTTTASDEQITITGKKLGEAQLKATVLSGSTPVSKICAVSVGYTFNTIIDSTQPNKIFKTVDETLTDSTKPITATELTTNEEITWPRDSFNCKLNIGKEITTIDDNFLTGCKAFNNGVEANVKEPFIISNSVTSIGTYFLNSCEIFNQKIIFPANDNFNSIGREFLYKCKAFNNGASENEDEPFVIPNSITNIDTFFLDNCKKFNQKVVLPTNENFAKISKGFLWSCSAFNKPIVIPNNITYIDESFLAFCKAFNQEILLPNQITTIGEQFLIYCDSFNNGSIDDTEKPLNLPNSITTINNSFLSDCIAFNQPINLPVNDEFNKIDYNFLIRCSKFNKPINIPSNVKTIGTYFLYQCSSFNQKIELPDNESFNAIPEEFLTGLSSFRNGSTHIEGQEDWSEPLVIPSRIGWINSKFLAYAQKLDYFILDFSKTDPEKIKFDTVLTSNFLKDVPTTNHIKFKMPSDPDDVLKNKIQAAANPTGGWPETWIFEYSA